MIGQGYVGLSLACGAATAGMEVVGIDTDADRVAELRQGRLVVPGVDEASFGLAMATGRLRFDVEARAVSDADVVVMAVPTPVVDHRPDTSCIESAATSVAAHVRPGTLVVLESTTYSGTTDELVGPLLEARGHRVGEDVLLAYSPERIDPGNVKFGLANTPRIVGGTTPMAGELAAAFYAHVVDEVHVLSDARTAEMAKLLENTFRMVNIALVNELATMCREQHIDVWEVVRAAATKPFGYMPFLPGPGVGGHCIPLDPEYLAWQSRRATGRRFRLVELAQDINADMPDYVTRRIADALNDHGKAVRGANVLVLGVTYKPDVGDIRESASVRVIEGLCRRGAEVAFHDPFVDGLDLDGRRHEGVPLTSARVRGADVVALLTPHAQYDVEWLAEQAVLLFDARNATGDIRQRSSASGHVVVL